MDLLFSILQKDYYIKMDFLDNMISIPTTSFTVPLNDLLNLKKIKIENLLLKLYSNSEISFEEKLLYVKTNYKDILVEDAPFAILFEEENNSKYEIYLAEVLETIKSLYRNFFDLNINVNVNNFNDFLNRTIEPTGIIKDKVKTIYIKHLSHVNNEQLNYVLTCFNLKLFNIDINKESINHAKEMLKIFFRVIGSDFSKLMKEDITVNDPFSISFVKFNRFYILDLKDRIDLLELNELVILIYFLCFEHNIYGSFISAFSQRYHHRFDIYKSRTILIHKKI
jgi:hypothetical protein